MHKPNLQTVRLARHEEHREAFIFLPRSCARVFVPTRLVDAERDKLQVAVI